MISELISPQTIGLTAGVLTASSLFPQLIKIIREKKADDISIPMLLILMTGLSLWIYYGTIISDLPLILTNSFSLCFNLLIIFFKFKYKKAPTEESGRRVVEMERR
jgi:MtN3 and saliva related transmembrane protein